MYPRRTRRAPLLALLGWFLATAAGCAGSGTDARREPLPFVVRVNPVLYPEGDAAGGLAARQAPAATPPMFGNLRQLTLDLADALAEAGVFTRVVTGSSPAADLELDVVIKGNDFGPGTLRTGGVFFSTIAWFFAGHASWVIDNREYLSSNVQMDVSIQTPGAGGDEDERPRTVFQDILELKGLSLNLLERGDVLGLWLLNIFLPPWWGDGNTQKRGESLARRALDHFVSQETSKIAGLLPLRHHTNLRCFLVHRPAENAVLIVTLEDLRIVEITRSGGSKRLVGLEEVRSRQVLDEEEKERIRLDLSAAAPGIGRDPRERFYHIPLAPEERGLVRVAARLAEYEGRWTIDRRAVPASAPAAEIATARP